MAATTSTDLPALDTQAREEAGGILQHTLVELVGLSLIGKQLHWNIAGPGFRDFHLHLDELVDEWRELSDTVAERITALGIPADGRAPTVVADSGLEPVESGFLTVPEGIRQLTRRVADVDGRVRERAEHLGELDLTSQDVLIDTTRALEKQLWMIRSQL